MSARFGYLLIASVVFSALAAVLTIPLPFMGDQALFVVFARMIDDGAVLYRDIWDVKQPGIFWFVLVAGRLFGFDEIGVHLFEALYWIAASVLIAVALRPHLRRSWLAALFPVVGSGWYLAVAHNHVLTQVETVIGPLVFAVAWLLLDRPGGLASPRLVFLAGLAAGTIAVFKLLAALIPLAILVSAVGWSMRKGRRAGAVLNGLLLPFGSGFGVVAVAVVGWVWVNGLGEVVWFTWIQYPPKALELEPRPLSRLLGAGLGFSAVYAPLGLLALIRVASRRYTQLTLLMVAALTSTILVVLLQLWWSYHFFLLMVPIAVLALQGLDILLDASRRTTALVAVLLALLAVPGALRVGGKAARVADVVAGESLVEYRERFSHYARASADAAAVDIKPGTPIYVMGDPSIVYLLRADQAIPVNGWGPEIWSDEMWDLVGDDLAKSQVAAVFLSVGASSLAVERAPTFLDRLYTHYGEAIPTEGGVWLFPTE